MILRYAVVFVTVLLAGCNPEFSRRDARNAIGEYLDDAGLHLGETPWAGIAISIEWILRPTNALRTVRFQLVTAYQSSDPYDAAFTRSDAGWSLTRFDPDIFDLVADITLAGRMALSAHLLDPLVHLGGATREWRGERFPSMEESTVEELRRTGDSIRVLTSRAPPRSDLERLSNPDSLPANVIDWGVFPTEEPVLIWVRDRFDWSRICAWPFGPVRLVTLEKRDDSGVRSTDFAWIEGDGIQCKVDEETFPASPFDDQVVQMAREGGVWLD